MKSMYKEFRVISRDKVKLLCITHNYYTCGSNEDYEHLLYGLCDRKVNQTIDRIVEIAEDIIRHSNVLFSEELIGCVSWELINKCCTTFIKIV